MQSVAELPKRAQVAFLMHVVERLDEQAKQYDRMMHLCRRICVSEPSILINGQRIEWRFDCSDGFSNDEAEAEEVSILMNLDEAWLHSATSTASKDGPDLLGNCFAGPWKRTCSCGSTGVHSSVCVHFLASIAFMRDFLSKASATKAVAWMEEHAMDCEKLGDDILRTVEKYLTKPSLPQVEGHRIQWRLNERVGSLGAPRSLRLTLALQKKSAKGKWSVGREISDIEAARQHMDELNPDDELIALISDEFNAYSFSNGQIFLRMIQLLQAHPTSAGTARGFHRLNSRKCNRP